MKKTLLFCLLFLSLHTYGQLDITHFTRIQIGLMSDRTDVEGGYLKFQGNGLINTGYFEKNMKDYRSCTGYEVTFLLSGEKGVMYGNLEGLLWIAGHILQYSHNNDYDVFIDKFTAAPLHNIPGSGTSIKFMNNHLLDFYSSYGKGSLCVGYNVGLRIIGLPSSNTTYFGKNEDGTNNPSLQYMSSSSGITKLVVGANLCYRKAITNNMALICFGGINTLPRIKSSSYALNIKYNPFISPSLYFGENKGLYIGLYYEWMKGTAKPTVALLDGKTSLDFSESQLQLKLGYSFKTKRHL